MCCVCVDELLRIVLINARVLALDSAARRRGCAVLLSVYVHICVCSQICTYIHRGLEDVLTSRGHPAASSLRARGN